MDDIASLLAMTTSWVAPGAPPPDGAETISELRRLHGTAARLAGLFDGQGKRIAGYYEATHPINSASLSVAIAQTLGETALQDLVLAALVHDLGMCFVPPPIRHKMGALTAEELAILRRHPEHGSRLVEPICGAEIANVLLAHHERWDGTGYPRGLAGTDIPLVARILAVADSFDAMSSDRIHARRYSPALAYQAVRASAGRAFDPAVVSAFLAAVSPFPPGTRIRLASGEVGVVTQVSPERPFRPAVRLPDGTTVEGRDVAGLQVERASPRFTAGVPVALFAASETLDGRTINLSEEGAAVIEYSGTLRQAGDLRIEFRPKGREELAISARVVWSRPSGGRGRLLGLWFGRLPAEQRAYIQSLTGSEPDSGQADSDDRV